MKRGRPQTPCPDVAKLRRLVKANPMLKDLMGAFGVSRPLMRRWLAEHGLTIVRRYREGRPHNYVHGLWRAPTYAAWSSAKRRCYKKTCPQYRNYGGRGIEVCERWRNSFENFLADMGECPSPQHSLDRIDNDGDYGPDNCRWATRTVQARNRSNNKLVSYNGTTKLLIEWAEQYSMPYETLSSRLRMGWPIHEALTRQTRKYAPRRSTN